MDLSAAERLTASSDPKAIAALQQQSNNPAVAKAVAEQFGTLLMQRVMQDADGEALGLATGTGGNIVNSMFASTMSQAAMSGDKLGLADLLFRSMAAKQSAASGAAAPSNSDPAAPSTKAPPPMAVKSSTSVANARAVPTGFALTPYWQANGLRPLGTAGPVYGAGGSPVGLSQAFALPPRNAGLTMAMLTAPAPASGPVQPNAGGNTPAANPTEVSGFSRQMLPLLQSAARTLGVSAKTLLAHAALETGWGRAVVGNNVFGIKAGSSWSGARVVAQTHEIENGQSVPQLAAFRAYPSLGAAVQDYVTLISERYRSAQGAGEDARQYGEALIAGGYATDTDYPNKLQAVAGSAAMAAAFAGDKPVLAQPIKLVNW